MTDLEQRNSAIAREYANGATRRELSEKYGLCFRTIGLIANAQGVRLSKAEQARRTRRSNVGRPRFPETDRKHYAKLRRIYSAAKARELMGLPQ